MDLVSLLEDASKQGASDLHLSVEMPPLMRKNGAMQPLRDEPLDRAAVDDLLDQMMDDGQKAFFPEMLELDFAITAAGERFRVNAFHTVRGPAAALRVIDMNIRSLEQLGAPPTFAALADLENGLLLVTGPTGSGKSTTLAAIIDRINRKRSAHIVTIEDPVEFLHVSQRSLITQREVGRHTRSFDIALKSALREDPDVILVGEMRDPETIALALTAAETGHLVLGTLHTPSAPRAVYRIIDATPAGEREMVRAMLANSLQAVIAQTLLPKIGGGRVALHEVLIGTSAVRAMIRESMIPQLFSAIQTGSRVGMQSMEQAVQMRIEDGSIDPETGAAALRALSGEDLVSTKKSAPDDVGAPSRTTQKAQPSGFSF